MVGNKPIWAVVTFLGSQKVASLFFVRLSPVTVYFSFASKTVGNIFGNVWGQRRTIHCFGSVF
jgi:hypothetical protein